MDSLKANKNIKSVVVIDLTEQGDKIRAGMSAADLVVAAPSVTTDLSRQYGQDDGAGHFYYNGSGPESVQRRRDLANRLREIGLR